MPNFTNTYNLYKITKTNQYFIAHQSIPFTKFPYKQNFTLETQTEQPTPSKALQYFSQFNPITIYIHNTI